MQAREITEIRNEGFPRTLTLVHHRHVVDPRRLHLSEHEVGPTGSASV